MLKAIGGGGVNITSREKIRVTADFWSNIDMTDDKQSGIFKVLKEKQFQTIILYTAKIFFKKDSKLFVETNTEQFHQQTSTTHYHLIMSTK